MILLCKTLGFSKGLLRLLSPSIWVQWHRRRLLRRCGRPISRAPTAELHPSANRARWSGSSGTLRLRRPRSPLDTVARASRTAGASSQVLPIRQSASPFLGRWLRRRARCRQGQTVATPTARTEQEGHDRFHPKSPRRFRVETGRHADRASRQRTRRTRRSARSTGHESSGRCRRNDERPRLRGGPSRANPVVPLETRSFHGPFPFPTRERTLLRQAPAATTTRLAPGSISPRSRFHVNRDDRKLSSDGR
jgi:hypothetical protein